MQKQILLEAVCPLCSITPKDIVQTIFENLSMQNIWARYLSGLISTPGQSRDGENFHDRILVFEQKATHPEEATNHVLALLKDFKLTLDRKAKSNYRTIV